MKFHAPWICIAAVIANGTASAGDLKLSSPDIGPDKPLAQAFVYSGYGCTGANQSPALAWSGAPAGSKSFAVTLFDPDAMQGHGFWHWLMVNIPATTNSLPRDAGKTDGSKEPAGALQIRNDFRAVGYGGSCPPTSDEPHRYVYTVYALKIDKLNLPPDAAPSEALETIQANALAKATLSYRFGRKAN